MARRNPPAKWVLPEIVDPPERVCYTVAVPNERMHIAAFKGALLNLASAIHWADDEAHTAREVALVWREIFDNLCASETDASGDCCMECSPVNGDFLDGLEPGETKTLRLVVEAGEYNLLPVLLFANQSITLSDFRGQWRDSTYHPETDCSSNWETPLGIVINAGGPSIADTFITDVMPDVPHMKLIMRVNNCGILTYHDIDDPMTFTVPSSVSPEGVFVEFLPNVPVDGNGEIASGFLGYGMVCLKAVISDPNLCAQVFINFQFSSLPFFDLITGTIVSSSPIGDGAALEAVHITPNNIEAVIDIPLDDCVVQDFAFTLYKVDPNSPPGDIFSWLLYGEEGEILGGGFETLSLPDETVTSFTFGPGTPVEHCFKLRLTWQISHEFAIPSVQLFIDNVFVN